MGQKRSEKQLALSQKTNQSCGLRRRRTVASPRLVRFWRKKIMKVPTRGRREPRRPKSELVLSPLCSKKENLWFKIRWRQPAVARPRAKRRARPSARGSEPSRPRRGERVFTFLPSEFERPGVRGIRKLGFMGGL